MKVLVSAYACEPNKGSEPGMGWNWVKQISRFHEVWAITRANNREVIKEELKKKPLPNVHFCYFDLPYVLRFYKRGGRGIQLYYYLWQIGIYFLAKKLNHQIGFDVIQHVTFTGVHKPSFLSFLPVPFIWGPVATSGFPWRFITEVGLTGAVSEILRIVRNSFCMTYDPFLRWHMKRSAIIIPANNYTLKMIPQKYDSKCILLSQVGVSDILKPDLENNNYRNRRTIHIFSLGRLALWKGFGMAIKAFAQFVQNNKDLDANFVIVGEGPDEEKVKRIAKKYNMEDRICFLFEQLDRISIMEKMRAADIFLYPSLRDSGGFVIVESLMASTPVICLDIGGPGEIVTKECGIKIKPENSDQVVRDIAAAIEKLARDEELKKRLGEGGRKRIEDIYDWDKKGEEINKIYEEVMGKEVS